MRYAPPHAPLDFHPSDPPAPPVAPAVEAERCEVCDSPSLYWRSCKQVCANCRTINKSCADL
jgi:hypothetical protein